MNGREAHEALNLALEHAWEQGRQAGLEEAKSVVAKEPIALSIKEAAKTLGISLTTAYDQAKSGELPTRRLGGRILVLVEELKKKLAVTEPLPRG